MILQVAEEARLEFEVVERYYQQLLRGLGARIGEEARAGLRRFRTWPLAEAVERGDIRGLTLADFPTNCCTRSSTTTST